MKIVMGEGIDQRVYKQPTVDEIVTLFSDNNVTPAMRDVIVRLRPSADNMYALQRVPSTSSLYHLLHYVLLFPRGIHGQSSLERNHQRRIE
jgi:hypothetical protein